MDVHRDVTVKRWLKRLGAGLLILLVLALATGGGWERWSRSQVTRDLPAPGRLVDVGGHALHLRCLGQGSPTIILEAGLGVDASTSWDPVIRDLAGISRVCAYDRGGLLWSEPGPGPRDAERVVAELHALLSASREAPPFVLVGHSLGGLFARVYAGRHPDEVAGLVLVDASHPEQQERMPDDVVAFMEASMPPPTLMRVLASTGILRWTTSGPPGSDRSQVAPAMAYFPRSVNGLLGEAAALPTIAAQAARPDTGLGDLPLVVLVAGEEPDNFPPDVPEEMKARMRQWHAEVWPVLQREQAALSTRGELRTIEGASHYIHHDQPRAVVDAVADVVRAVRGR